MNSVQYISSSLTINRIEPAFPLQWKELKLHWTFREALQSLFLLISKLCYQDDQEPLGSLCLQHHEIILLAHRSAILVFFCGKWNVKCKRESTIYYTSFGLAWFLLAVFFEFILISSRFKDHSFCYFYIFSIYISLSTAQTTLDCFLLAEFCFCFKWVSSPEGHSRCYILKSLGIVFCVVMLNLYIFSLLGLLVLI